MKNNIKNITIILLFIFVFLPFSTSCTDDGTGQTWEFADEDDGEKGEAKPRIVWIDAAANFPDFANSKENIKRDLQKAVDAGFTGIVVDVRPTMGDVLFKTNHVDQVKWLGAWLPNGFSKVERTATWDYLGAFIEIGHELGLKVYAGINTFTAGNKNSLGTSGLLYRDASKKEWATSILTKDKGIVNTLDTEETSTKFFNPVHEDVQEFMLKLVEDLAAYKDLDGIFLDRGRFDELRSDFSDYTKTKFEKFLGQNVKNFPNDVVTPDMLTGGLPTELPIHFKKWLEFRAKTIHDFMEKAQKRAKAKNPEVQFGVYVGAWYGTYYEVGVNWASKKHNTAQAHPKWASADYSKYGYAEFMDLMLIGAYASPDAIRGSNDWTVQGFCKNAMTRIKGDAIVIGGPDIGNGKWATEADAVVNNAITESVDAAINSCDGYFLFDMIHLKKKDQWQYVKAGIDGYLESTQK